MEERDRMPDTDPGKYSSAAPDDHRCRDSQCTPPFAKTHDEQGSMSCMSVSQKKGQPPRASSSSFKGRIYRVRLVCSRARKVVSTRPIIQLYPPNPDAFSEKCIPAIPRCRRCTTTGEDCVYNPQRKKTKHIRTGTACAPCR